MRRMLGLTVSGAALFAAACTQDAGVKHYNNPPEAAFKTPQEGQEFAPEAGVSISAKIDDANQSPDTLDYEILFDREGETITDLAVDVDGNLTASWQPVATGAFTLTLHVSDQEGEEATDTVAVTIASNTAPTVDITSHEDGDTIELGVDPLKFTGQVDDAEDGPASLVLEWTAGGTAFTECGAATDETGYTECRPKWLDAIESTEICLSAIDPDGAEGIDCVTISVTGCADSDHDGYDSCEDCDDHDADIYPGAPEECNNKDDDCNGKIDEDGSIDAPIWYPDVDKDGWGNDVGARQICEDPGGYVDKGGDCNDGDADYHPGADESNCSDPNDYNCDGSTGTQDKDKDGYNACQECDDTRNDVNPGLDEVCDGVDHNCDGETC